MAESEVVNARIVYWGPPGAGVTQSLRTIRSKLRGGGDLRELPTALDPTLSYELLPISLGRVGGVQTELQILSVPSSPEAATTRKQLLDQVDGLVFVADATPERMEANVAALDELRATLSAYGRDTGNLPIVIQYNKCDLADSYQIEALHRRLGLTHAAVFESIATEGKGVLKALTTVSKQVIRLRRDRVVPPAAIEPEPLPSPPAAIELTEPLNAAEELDDPTVLAAAILSEGADGDAANAAQQTALEAETLFDRPWEELAEEAKQGSGARIGPDFQIVSVGTVTREGARSIRVPLVLGNPEGETVSMALSIALDPVLDGE